MMFDSHRLAVRSWLVCLRRLVLVRRLGAILMATILGGSVLCSPALAQPPVRSQVFANIVQAFVNGLPFEDFSSEIGFRYYGAATEDEEIGPCGCADLASDGFILNIANSAAWSDADPGQSPGYEHALRNEMRFLFRGSGLDLLYAANSVGEDLGWEIVDGGSEGAFTPVASGSFSTFAATSTLNTAQLAVPGSLATDRLYMLRVWPDEGTGGASTPKWLSLDALDVYDNQDFSIDDSRNVFDPNTYPRGSWLPGPTWGDDLDTNQIPAIGGGTSRSTTDDATMTVLFNGSSLAIFGSQIAGETATYDWQVDGGGPGLEGTIDQTLDSDFAYRWPQVIVNGLPYGEHSVVVTVRNNGGSGTAGDLGPKPQLDGGSTEFDAISIISFADLDVRADFDIDRDVDGSDFLLWQQGFGIQQDVTRAEGDANRDRQVDNIDFLIWQSELSNTVPATTPVTMATARPVPEPNTTILVWFVALFMQRTLTKKESC